MIRISKSVLPFLVLNVGIDFSYNISRSRQKTCIALTENGKALRSNT